MELRLHSARVLSDLEAFEQQTCQSEPGLLSRSSDHRLLH